MGTMHKVRRHVTVLLCSNHATNLRATPTLLQDIFARYLAIVHRHRRSVWSMVNLIHWMRGTLQQYRLRYNQVM